MTPAQQRMIGRPDMTCLIDAFREVHREVFNGASDRLNGIIKRPRPPRDTREEYIFAMWLTYCRAPGRKTAPGEPVDLGEIGACAEKNWIRLTPYSPAHLR
jgi:hypothetical protein